MGEMFGRIIKGLLIAKSKTAKSENPVKMQREQLLNILYKSKDTVFGRDYDFHKILNNKDFVKSFQENVPFFDYDKMYENYWHRFNEEDVCWPGRFEFFATTSGTTRGPSKHIPVSKEMVKSIHNGNRKKIVALTKYNLPYEVFKKDILYLGGSTDLKEENGIKYGDLSGIATSQAPRWFNNFKKPEKDISKLSDWNEKIDMIVKRAKDWDVGIIGGIPPWVLMLFERLKEQYGFDNIHELWPNLSLYIHGGVPFGPYKRRFESFLGKKVERMESYIASEGFIGVQEKPGEDMKLVVDNNTFFEFIPFDKENFENGEPKKNAKALAIDKVKKDVPYALLVTNCSGAYRYLIGDVIRFTNKKRGMFKFAGRTKHYLSVCAEHVSSENLDDVIEELEERTGIAVEEYTVASEKVNGFFRHHWYISCEGVLDKSLAEDFIDKNLKDKNRDYKVRRQGPLKKPSVTILDSKKFYGWMEKQGKLGGQNKFPKVLNEEQKKDWQLFLKE